MRTHREREIEAAILLGMRPAEYRDLDDDERMEVELYLDLQELKRIDEQRYAREHSAEARKKAEAQRRIEEQEARLRGERSGPPAFPRGKRGR